MNTHTRAWQLNYFAERRRWYDDNYAATLDAPIGLFALFGAYRRGIEGRGSVKIVRSALSRYLLEHAQGIGEGGLKQMETMHEAIGYADAELRVGQEKNHWMGGIVTAVVVTFSGDRSDAVFVRIGSSGIYRMRNNQLQNLAAGVATAEEPFVTRKRSGLGGQDLEVTQQTGLLKVARGDKLLLTECFDEDGQPRNYDDGSIAKAMSSKMYSNVVKAVNRLGDGESWRGMSAIIEVR